MFLRIAEPIELWDGTGADPAADLAAQPDWSLYEVGDLSPITIVASFFGNRTGHNPKRDIGYVLFTEAELLATGGAIRAVPASFGWPPEVVAAHRDLVGHEQNAKALLAAYHPATRLKMIPRASWLAELVVLACREDVVQTFRENVVKRLRRLRTDEGALWSVVIATCSDHADPVALIA